MIILINPPQLYTPTQETAGVVPPLGLAYVASALTQADYNVDIIDAVGEKYWQSFPWGNHTLRGLNFDEIIDKITKDVQWIGISNLYTFSFLIASALAQRLKSEFNQIPIVFGGAHSTMMPEHTLSKPFIDAVVLSEGENTAVQLTEAFNGEVKFSDIDGLAYKGSDGAVLINPKTEFIKDLDSIPFPRRDLLPMENYFKAREPHGNVQARNWTTMIASRGCPYECTFCNTPTIWQRRWRIRSPQNVVDEMKELVDQYGVEEVHFEDENLAQRRKWMMEFADLIEQANLRILWQPSNGIRAESADFETVAVMKRAGCTNITIAAESGSERILREVMKKNLKLEAVEKAVNSIYKNRINCAVYFMLGLPGELKRDVFKSIFLAGKLARKGATEVVFSIFSPLPGSELTATLIETGKINANEEFFDNITPHGDMLNSQSYSEYISDRGVVVLKYMGYLWFYLNRMIFHPLNFLNTFINVYKGKQTSKTERVIGTMIKRFLGKEEKMQIKSEIQSG